VRNIDAYLSEYPVSSLKTSACFTSLLSEENETLLTHNSNDKVKKVANISDIAFNKPRIGMTYFSDFKHIL
jgi:hypothetical protein